MDGNDQGTGGKCPVVHLNTSFGVQSNRDWWPNQLNLKILAQNSELTDPMGDFDYVKKVLTEIGDMAWMQVAIKPAKPLAFGAVDGTPIFGLPGNPVSSMVSFELFARPGIAKMMGHADPIPVPVRGVAGADMSRRPDGKTHFARVHAVLTEEGLHEASFSGGQGSHQLSAMAAANALAVIPDGDGIAKGEPVDLLLL